MLSQHHHSAGLRYPPTFTPATPYFAALAPPSSHPTSPPSPSHHHHSTPHTTPPLRENAGSRAHRSTCKQKAKGGSEKMILYPNPLSMPQLSDIAWFPLQSAETNHVVAPFTFHVAPKPSKSLTFSPPEPPPRPRKRGRALTDIDGEHSCLYKKKRRLRLFLITSRLSPEFSLPATNIVDRGSSKIAIWMRQRALGRNLLRKAAILNRIRRRRLAERIKSEMGLDLDSHLPQNQEEHKQLELAKLAFVYGSHDTHTRPTFKRSSSFPPATASSSRGKLNQSSTPPRSRSATPPPDLPSRKPDAGSSYQSPNDAYADAYLLPRSPAHRKTTFPLPPSPLGLSNYDAFDLEDDIPDPYSHLDDEEGEEEQEDGWEAPAPGYGYSPMKETPTERPPASPSSTDSTLLQTPPPPPQSTFYSDFSILDSDTPLLDDYDDVDEVFPGAWTGPGASLPLPLPLPPPSSTTKAATTFGGGIASCSPNFTALLSTAPATPRRGVPDECER